MRFKTIIFKDMLRCVKEQGIYCEFKQKLKRYIYEKYLET